MFKSKTEKQDNRFFDVGKEYSIGGSSRRIVVDKKTGVQYLWYEADGGKGGLTVLLNSDGKPLLYQPT